MTPGSGFLGGANPSPLVKFGIRLAMFVTGFVCTFVYIRLSDRNDAAPANNGLKKNDLKNLPKLTYAAANNDSLSDCAICQVEFVDGDELRVLPQCDHGFHISTSNALMSGLDFTPPAPLAARMWWAPVVGSAAAVNRMFKE